MSAEFVPFLSGVRSRTNGASSANGASPAPANGFSPMGAPKAAPQAAPSSPSAPQTPPPCTPSREPRVEVKRSGDRITHIQVTCKCGEVVEIECEY